MKLSRCQRRMSAEVISEPRVSGALASRSRLAVGQRSEGSRERVVPSDIRQALRRSRRWTCSWLIRSSGIGGGLWIGGAARPSRRACWRPRPNRCSPVCPRPGTSEKAVAGLVASDIRAASGITKKGGDAGAGLLLLETETGFAEWQGRVHPGPGSFDREVCGLWTGCGISHLFQSSALFGDPFRSPQGLESLGQNLSQGEEMADISCGVVEGFSGERTPSPISSLEPLLLVIVTPSRSSMRAASPTRVKPAKRAAMLVSYRLRIRNP